MSSVDQA